MKLITAPESGFRCKFFIMDTMQKVITILRDILTPLCKNRKDLWDNEDWIHIFAEWPPLAREDIEVLFKLAKTEPEPVVDFLQSQRGQVLYLPPLEKDPDCVPILSLYFKLKETQSIAKLRVLLVSLDENRKPDGIYGIGFRMETPERRNQNVSPTTSDQSLDTVDIYGAHDFHHAQLIRKFGQKKLDDKLQIDCPIWLPESQPSFPLPADCPVTMLLCLIVTLYGRTYYNDFLSTYGTSELQEYQNKLYSWINPDQLQKKQREETENQLTAWEKRKQSKRVRK